MSLFTDFEASQWVTLAAAALFVAVGVVVLATRRRSWPGIWFAAFLITFGVRIAVEDAFVSLLATAATFSEFYQSPLWLFVLVYVAAGVSLFGVGLTFPKLVRLPRRTIAIVALGVLAVRALYLAPVLEPDTLPIAGLGMAESLVTVLSMEVFQAGLIFAQLMVLAKAFHAGAGDQALLHAAAMFSIGSMALFLINANAVDGMIPPFSPATWSVTAGMAVNILLHPVAWALLARGPHARFARNVSLTLVTISISAVVAGIFVPDLIRAIPRFAAALFWGIAILTGFLPGMDIRLRFAISKGTLAAIFIAAFFVTSEAAQQFFGDTLGSTYAGIAAAGGLVFVIAPLSRVVDRLAATAVPYTSSSGRPPHLEAYYQQAAVAWRDGAITSKERDMLRTLRRTLSIDAEVADALETHAQRPTDAPGAVAG